MPAGNRTTMNFNGKLRQDSHAVPLSDFYHFKITPQILKAIDDAQIDDFGDVQVGQLPRLECGDRQKLAMSEVRLNEKRVVRPGRSLRPVEHLVGDVAGHGIDAANDRRARNALAEAEPLFEQQLREPRVFRRFRLGGVVNEVEARDVACVLLCRARLRNASIAGVDRSFAATPGTGTPSQWRPCRARRKRSSAVPLSA